MSTISEAVLSQIHLSGEIECPQFKPHMLKANFCINCSKLINKHSPQSIPDEDCLLKAIEFSQKGEKTPSCILPTGRGLGALYHGGFKAVMNAEFLRKENITHILNTAKGLEIFGPKYLAAVELARGELGVTVLEMNWEDSTHFAIPHEDLARSSKFIHAGRLEGGSVLVHCAQGKSRSATAVIGYLLTISDQSYEECESRVQEQRKMAEPNPSFKQTLIEFSKSDTLKHLKQELAT